MIALAQQPKIIEFPTVAPQGKSNEWYTPARYIEAAREVMGKIDLDPASCELANRTVKATQYYTQFDNGLCKHWCGWVWLNPPYGTTNGRSNQGIWARRLIHEYQIGNVQEAILLITAATDMKWFKIVWDYLICFVERKIHFYGLDSESREHPQGACFVYLGSNEHKFIDVFSQFGTIAKRVSPPRQTIATPSLWEVQ